MLHLPQLLTGGGDGHGHVHHRSQGGDEDAADHEAADLQRSIVGPQDQVLRFGHVEPADGGDLSHDPGKQTGCGHAAYAPQARAQRLAGKAGEQQEGGRGGESRYGDGGGNGGHAPQDQGDQQKPDAQQGIDQSQQGHDALFPADKDQHQSEYGDHSRQHPAAVIVRNGDDVGRPIFIRFQPDNHPRAQGAIYIGVGAQIVHALQDVSLVGAAEDLQLQDLGAQPQALAPRLGLGVVGEDVVYPGRGEKPLLGGGEFPALLAEQEGSRRQQKKAGQTGYDAGYTPGRKG